MTACSLRLNLEVKPYSKISGDADAPTVRHAGAHISPTLVSLGLFFTGPLVPEML